MALTAQQRRNIAFYKKNIRRLGGTKYEDLDVDRQREVKKGKLKGVGSSRGLGILTKEQRELAKKKYSLKSEAELNKWIADPKNAYKKSAISTGKTKTTISLPSKEEMKNKISIKQKGNAGVIEDVIFPNDKMKEKFLKELRRKYKLVPGKAMPEKFKAANFAKRYPISERQFERMVSYYVNKLGLKYPKGGEAAQVKAKRDKLFKKVTGHKTEATISGPIKKPILREKNLVNKIDLAHRVSAEHMARLGLEFDTRLIGIDSRLINQIIVKPSEFKLNGLYKQQYALMQKIEKSGLTSDLKQSLINVNKAVKKEIRKTSGRLIGITIDPETLEPAFEGLKKKFSLSSEEINLKELDKLPRPERIKILAPHVAKKVDAEIKRGFRPYDFKEILGDPKNRTSIINYAKRYAPDIWGKVKDILKNPLSKRRFALFSKFPAVAIPAAIAMSLMAPSEGRAEDQVPGTVDQVSEVEAEEPRITDQSTMKYNSTTGTFDNTLTGDPEDQTGVLNWIADNPGKGGFAALPAFMGLGYGLSAAGMKKAGQHLMGWKAIIPAMMIPEKMYQWKQGMEAGEMATDPLNAIWALGIENKASLAAAEKWYNSLPEGQRSRLGLQTLKDLRTTQGWKNLPQAFRNAVLSPAAAGTDLAFQKRLKPLTKKLTESIIGSPFTKQAAKKGLGALAVRGAVGLGAAAALGTTVAAGLVSAPLTLGLGALSFGYAQYKDYRDGKAIVDGMRAKGQISEEDADNYMSLIKQGSLPFGLGNRIFGDEEMTLRGQTYNPEQQRELLRGMEDQIDLFQDKRKDVRALDRADDFGFSEGGRVGMKTGGMDRRGFLKWLATLGATVIGGATGLFKTGAKKGIEQVVKQAPKQFANVPGMPAWFPRAVQKIKTHGKLIEMADKDYVNGDIYEMMIPTKVPQMEIVAGKETMSGFKTVDKKVILEENPISGEIEMTWKVDDFDGEMTRQINFKPGQSGFQKFGADPEHPGAWEYQRVKVEEPEFTYGNPDQSTPERADFEFKDIFEEGDEVVKGLEDLTGNKKMVAKDGSIIETTDAPDVDEAFQKKIFKDIEGEEGLIPDPEGQFAGPEGDWVGDTGNEIIGGEIPKHLQKKAGGGTVETGDIARRQSLVPPLSGPDPQGIMGLYSAPKQVRLG